jgi:hypothetical protein
VENQREPRGFSTFCEANGPPDLDAIASRPFKTQVCQKEPLNMTTLPTDHEAEVR